MTDVEASYLAGLFDGEGCVVAFRQRGGFYSPYATIGMTAGLPHELWMEWGGLFYARSRGLLHKPCNVWEIRKQGELHVFFQKIKPYLRVKYFQVDLALRMLDILGEKSEGWKEELNRMAEEMHRLNKKGRVPP